MTALRTSQSPRRKPRENQFLFDLGVRGRKTGLTLPDTGIRDEHGLEPLDNLFSSPEKASPNRSKSTRKTNGGHENLNATLSSEEDMDVGESTIPEPTAVLTERKRATLRMPPPRSTSPIKTFLQSPARRNPSLGPVSSPIRGSVMTPREAGAPASVRRKLDFSTGGFEANTQQSNTRSGATKLTNPTRLLPLKRGLSPDNGDDGNQDQSYQALDGASFEDGGDVYQIGNNSDDEGIDDHIEDGEEPSESPSQPSRSAKKKGLKGPATVDAVKRGRGRPPKKPDPPVEQDQDGRPAKKARRSLEASKPAPKPSMGKTSTYSNGTAAAKKRGGRKPALAPIPEAESPEIRRGPPLPRNSRGLYILRRETPIDGNGFKQTRSGRTSVKPVAFWKNERIEYEEDEAQDGDTKFLLSRIKEVVRADEVEPTVRSRNRPNAAKGRKAKRRTAEPESDSDIDYDDNAEPWEIEPGRFMGDIRVWDPEDQTGFEAQEAEDEIALSSAAIVSLSRDIPGGLVRFAKTLALPFFGSGMVDLPPGAIKKPKNSRMMQMAFFVFTGRVQVTVNDNVFSIGKGGMWQVPRGNFYSIMNDYDKPARIFFSQGCEVQEELSESQ